MFLKLLLSAASIAFVAIGVPERTVTSVMTDLAGQDWAAEPVLHTISGTVCLGGAGLAGVTIQAVGVTRDGQPCNANAVTGADGKYAVQLPDGWTGTLTPVKAGYTFAARSCSAP